MARERNIKVEIFHDIEKGKIEVTAVISCEEDAYNIYVGGSDARAFEAAAVARKSFEIMGQGYIFEVHYSDAYREFKKVGA